MKWFNNPETLEDLKKQYKKLAFQNHPDRGGKTSDMQEINAEYEVLFSRLKVPTKTRRASFTRHGRPRPRRPRSSWISSKS